MLFGDICIGKAIWEKYKMLAGMPKEEIQVGRHDMNGDEE